jgi:hypothetical protein
MNQSLREDLREDLREGHMKIQMMKLIFKDLEKDWGSYKSSSVRELNTRNE